MHICANVRYSYSKIKSNRLGFEKIKSKRAERHIYDTYLGWYGTGNEYYFPERKCEYPLNDVLHIPEAILRVHLPSLGQSIATIELTTDPAHDEGIW
jgi:hypothetical protein